MSTRLEDLPNELFLQLFSTYFDGAQLYKIFYGLNIRLNSILRSLEHIHVRLENSDDDPCLNLFTSKIISLFINAKHKSIRFIPLLTNIQAITLVNPTVVQIINLLQIGRNLHHVSIQWSNPYKPDLMSIRSFYELIFSANASQSLRSCRFYLPESHSLYLEPRHCTLPLLRTIYVQVNYPLGDFRRIIRLCPNLTRFEMEIIDNGYSNEETIIICSHLDHIHLRRFYIHNLLSLDILDIYIEYLPNLEYLYISMKLPSHPVDVFKHISSLIHRFTHLKQFQFRLSTDFWNLDHQQLEMLKQLNPFFAHIHIEMDDDEIVFVN
ncbi:unnamed protein product [Adineta ricciae]|uniref:F-box domain-containing protein n=1 Tax=Adineta ricciae TaxID=249248 RepID=A0A815Z9M9_ADIRI|nr:unnamed protein product [Adineta ricciae]